MKVVRYNYSDCYGSGKPESEAILFVATRDIACLEELCFDYEDKLCDGFSSEDEDCDYLEDPHTDYLDYNQDALDEYL